MNAQERYLAIGEPQEEGWMLKRLGVSRLTVLEWSITNSETFLEVARLYEPEQVPLYERDLQWLKTELAKELMIETHRQL